MSEIPKIRIGISVGDPNGIGFEIILKTFSDKRIFDFFTPVVFAHHKNLIEERKKLGITVSVFSLSNIKNPNNGQLNVVNIWDAPFPIVYGKEQAEAGLHAITSLETATLALKNGDVDVLVTAPIHKKSIQSKVFKFPGHTDYLNAQLEGQSLMFMVTDQLKVALMSDHIPLKDVVGYLNEDKINTKIALLEKSLIQDFGIKRPKIAVLGINPHTGDNGVIGEEDDTLLTPVIKKWNEKGSLVFGPYPADGFFGNQSYSKFDAVLATYHDQGLIPFKTLSFGQGVNFTAGLSHVRTSPDHGTAFDIAGKGVADPSSFSEAVYRAREIFLKRNEKFS
ncbi:MAG: 4-hydroxythreonine-4-phosphate dehydrogenase PdxA [Flavobacteriaceae bacterium]|nr:4-hydroxythreonine-4-phosphate dehydrogenase PdxA [Flavobacteriaceae bacterium]MDG2504426.1 4-hydroxythreonine-4-phosphate dehydrogenase PdxA [Flavobacteriaceae bacterium]